MRRHQKRAVEDETYPMMMNSCEAVMACRALFSYVSQKG